MSTHLKFAKVLQLSSAIDAAREHLAEKKQHWAALSLQQLQQQRKELLSLLPGIRLVWVNPN